jgi:hypothetical protein
MSVQNDHRLRRRCIRYHDVTASPLALRLNTSSELRNRAVTAPLISSSKIRRWLAMGVLAIGAVSSPALADEASDGAASIWRHGEVSRRFWAPDTATAEVGGLRLNAGLAIGVRTPLRSAVGARVAPALVLHTGRQSNVTLLAGSQGGAMLVWQQRQ